MISWFQKRRTRKPRSESQWASRVRAGVCLKPMVTAIDLDHELGAKAGEVHNVRADRRSSSKMRPFDRHTLEMPPQALFGVSRFGPKLARDGCKSFLGH